MQFSDTSNLTGLSEDITFITKADTNEYTLKDRARNLNQWYFRALRDVVSASKYNVWQDTSIASGADGSWTLDAADGSAIINITNGTRNYPLPATNPPWIIYRVAYKRDNSNFFDAMPFHIGLMGGNMNTTELDNNVLQEEPIYRLNGDEILLYPAPNANVTGGLKIWYIPQPALFASTDTTKKPEMNAVFHRILSLGASYDFLLSRGKEAAAPVRQELELLRAELKDYYGQVLDDSVMIMRADIQEYE